MAKNKSQYDSTLNLPKTLFEMRAGLPKKEPVMLKDWDDNDLYNQLMSAHEVSCIVADLSPTLMGMSNSEGAI